MKNRTPLFIAFILVCSFGVSSASGIVTPLSSSKADFEFTWTPNDESPDGWFHNNPDLGDVMYGELENDRDKRYQKLIYMIARFDFVPNLPKLGADIIIPDGQGSIISGGPANENVDISFSASSTSIIVEQSWLLSECPENEKIDLGTLHLSFREENGGVLDADNRVRGGTRPDLLSLQVRTRCLVPDAGATGGLALLAFLFLALVRSKYSR